MGVMNLRRGLGLLSLVMGPHPPPPEVIKRLIYCDCCYSSVKTRSFSCLEKQEQERRHSAHFSTTVCILPQPVADPRPT
jgi:hypothetical protein